MQAGGMGPKGLGRFCISVRSMRGAPEILELGKHSLET
jgi:hypothetical protein